MLTSLCRHPDQLRLKFICTSAGRIVLALILAWSGCTKQELPDLGPRLPQTVAMEFSPSLLEYKAEYTDNCGHIQIIDIGTVLQDMLLDAANQTFTSVLRPGSGAKPDVVVRVNLVRSAFKLAMDGVYDRAETELRLGGLISYADQAGAVLGEQEVQVVQKGRVRIMPLQKNCDYILDTFIDDATRDFAHRFAVATRAKLGPAGASVAAAAPAAIPVPVPVRPAPSGPAPLSFKATVLDDNGNLVFEGGERIRVRVDVVNTGAEELQSVTASLSGTPHVLAQFPSTTLSAGRLQPGQSRSIEFVATLPQAMQQQKADLQVRVSDPGAGSPPSQSLSLSIQPTGMNTDDVDQVPAMPVGFKRPHTYLISIGIGSYRDVPASGRKYAASDAELLTTYFQSLGGLPASNVRLLQDWKALRPDIDEALLDWLPGHMSKDAVVIVYFAGLATAAPNGEIYLVPYDGNTSNASRSYPLKDLETALSRLKAKQTIFFFDGIVSRLGADARSKTVLPQWNPLGSSTVHIVAMSGVGKALEDEAHRHGLFTYYLLRALRGESDINRDGEVTLGEAIAFVGQKVSWAAKTHYGQEQRPAVFPALKSTDPITALALTKLAAIKAAEQP